MVAQRLLFNATAGLGLTAFKLSLVESPDTIVASVAPVPFTGNPSRWYANFTDVPEGHYLGNAFIGALDGFAMETYEIFLAAGDYLPDSEQGIRGVLSGLSGSIVSGAMVSPAGKISRPITIGDDYLKANSRAFSWTVDPVVGFSVASVAVAWGGRRRFGGVTSEFSGTGTATLVSSRWLIECELPKAATEGLPAGFYDWSVELSVAGVEVTRIQNTTEGDRAVLLEKQT